jgi:hypothetical protein
MPPQHSIRRWLIQGGWRGGGWNKNEEMETKFKGRIEMGKTEVDLFSSRNHPLYKPQVGPWHKTQISLTSRTFTWNIIRNNIGTTYNSTRHHNPEDHHRHFYRRENLKSRIISYHIRKIYYGYAVWLTSQQTCSCKKLDFYVHVMCKNRKGCIWETRVGLLHTDTP